jgi:hypothetical protein
MTDINFSAAIGKANAADSADLPLWSFNGVKMLAGPGGSVILHKLQGDRRVMVQPNVADALRQCGPFRTIEAHTRRVIENSPLLREHAEHTRQTLQGLADGGIFESSDACWRRLTQGDNPRRGQAACRLFVLTCDRPVALDRLLSGLGEFPLPVPVEGVWIVDDSRDGENIKENAAIIERQAESARVPVVHVDLTFRRDLIQHLKSALPEYRHCVEWFLERSVWGAKPTYGLARNLALLLSVGKRSLVLDDDIIPQAIAPPLAAKNLAFATPNEREAQFYASREALSEHALPLPDSPLSMMLDALGQPLPALIAQHLTDHTKLAGTDGELLTRHSQASRVLISQCGSWGDPGTANGTWIINLPVSSVKKLLKQSDDLQGLLSARSHWHGYRGPALTHYGTLSQLTGLDHSVTLPPYLPAGRGEDLLFGIMMQRLHPDCAVWNEGWAIRHENAEDREHRTAMSPLSAKPGLSLLADFLGHEPRDHWGLSPAARLTGLAHQVRALATMELGALENIVREELVSKRGALLTQCIDHLQELGAMADLRGAPAWKAFLEQSRDQLVKELQTPEPNPLAKLGGVAQDQASIQQLREQGEQFGDGLEAWPSICEAAATFRV